MSNPLTSLANQSVRTTTLQPIVIQQPAADHPLPWPVIWLLPMLPILVTVFGWWLVGGQTDRRERRKDIRDSIGEIRKRVVSLEAHCGEYAQVKGSDPKAAVIAGQIKADLLAIPIMINLLGSAGMAFDRWDLVSALRQAATGGDFDTSNHKVGATTNLLVIGGAGMDLYNELDVAYFQSFPIRVSRKKNKLKPTA